MPRARGFAWLLTSCLASWQGAEAAAVCPDHGETKATIARIEARLELRLTDGRLIRLVGLDPALQTPTNPDLPDTSAGGLAAMVSGKEVTLTPLSGAPDRWGRIPAFVFPTADTTHPGGLAVAAIAAGLGRYLSEPAAHACRAELVNAEREARSARLGLWRDPYYAVLTVDDLAGFAERSATIVLAEGRLAAVQPSPYRTTLRFAAPVPGSHGGHMLVATIPPRVMKAFDAQHIDLKALVGQRLRFRGLLDQRFGPRIELDGPDALETDLAPVATATPAGPR